MLDSCRDKAWLWNRSWAHLSVAFMLFARQVKLFEVALELERTTSTGNMHSFNQFIIVAELGTKMQVNWRWSSDDEMWE